MIRVIHIGMHKTGSTFLQQWFWPALEHLYGREFEWERPHVKRFFHNSYLKRASKVVSQECLSGVLGPLRPGQSWERFQRFLNVATRIEIPPKVIMIVRDHRSWLRSAYLDKLKWGYRESFGDYLNRFDGDDLSWTSRADLLESYFSECFIDSYEQLSNHPKQFFKHLCEFLKVDAHPLLRIFDRISKQPVNSSPRTKFALRMARSIHSSPGSALTRLVAIPMLMKSYKDYYSAISRIRDQFVIYANRMPISKNLSIRVEIPPELAEILNSDWKAMSERFYKTSTNSEKC